MITDTNNFPKLGPGTKCLLCVAILCLMIFIIAGIRPLLVFFFVIAVIGLVAGIIEYFIDWIDS